DADLETVERLLTAFDQRRHLWILGESAEHELPHRDQSVGGLFRLRCRGGIFHDQRYVDLQLFGQIKAAEHALGHEKCTSELLDVLEVLPSFVDNLRRDNHGKYQTRRCRGLSQRPFQDAGRLDLPFLFFEFLQQRRHAGGQRSLVDKLHSHLRIAAEFAAFQRRRDGSLIERLFRLHENNDGKNGRSDGTLLRLFQIRDREDGDPIQIVQWEAKVLLKLVLNRLAE